MITDIVLAERAAAGAVFMDRHIKGWRDMIDLGELDIATSCNCALGQTIGEYNGPGEAFVEDRVDGVDENVVTLGFFAPSGLDKEGRADYYHRITKAWRGELQKEAA